MHNKMLRKCRGVAAITLAIAMLFGSMTVMAEGESIQAAEQETVATDSETEVVTEGKAVVLSEEKTTTTVEDIAKEPIFAPNVASWNGKDEIVFYVDTKGGAISEFSFNVYTASSEEPIGGAYAWQAHIEGNIDSSGVGEGDILFTDTLENFCEKQEIDEKEVEKIEFFLAVSYDGVSEKAVKTVTLPVELADIDWEKGEYRLANGKTYYMLDMKLGNGVLGYETIWSGPEDVREAVKDGKTYYFLLPNSEYPLSYMFDIDAKYKDTNNPISIKDGYKIQVKVVSGDGKAEPAGHGAPDWAINFTASKATTFEVSVVEEGISEPEETTMITDDSGKSGVSVQLPAEAPEGLTLKVTESDGTEEKEAVSKLVQVEGDKIKTFDLSLFMGDKEWNYDGQFKSTVTLPVPEGWNIGALGLYYFDEAANKVTAVPFTVDKANNTLAFETTHFSRFVMVQKDVKAGSSDNTGKPEGQNNAQNTNVPKTGDDTTVVLCMVMLFAAGVAIAGYARKRRA